MTVLKKDIVGRIGENVELILLFPVCLNTDGSVKRNTRHRYYSQVKKFYENGYDTYRVLWILVLPWP